MLVRRSSGASHWIESKAGWELEIYVNEKEAVASGLSPGLASSIFASGSGACGTLESSDPVPTFRCTDLGCSRQNRECRIWSADVNAQDDSTNRVEQPNDEGFVYAMPDRSYWCVCE